MSGFTVYFVNHVLEHCLGGVLWTPPTDVYLKLHKDDPGPDGSANASVVTTRKRVSFSSASGGAITVTNDISWTMASPESIGWLSGWDSLSAGNCLFTVKLEASKNLFSGDTANLPAGLTLRLSAGA
ncbi:phage tail fiber protein [Mycolicibacterium sphagni]|uniref:phage tail fiber protein n=1 Tax=Mycolicibacterium sphagni TaxID=1786 RepID=UPI00269BA743